MQRLFRESFVPVTLVLAGLFCVLLYVQYRVEVVSKRVTVIRIAATPETSALDEGGEDVGTEETEPERYSDAASEDPRYRQAAELMDAGKWADAEAAFHELLAARATSQALSDLGVVYIKQGRTALAREQFDLAVHTVPVYPGAYFNRGLLMSREGDFRGAAEQYRQVIRVRPNHFEARYNLGLALLRLDDPKGALEAFTQAAGLTGGERKARAQYGRGLSLRKLGPEREPEAKAAFESAIRLRPAYVAPRIALAEMEPRTPEGTRRGLAYFDEAVRLAPADPSVHFQRALFNSERGNRKAAIDAYRTAIQFNPEYVLAHYNLGILLLAEKHWNDARAQFTWILDRHPDEAEARFNLGRAAYGEKNYQEAISDYRKAIDLKGGDYPEAWLNTGLSHTRTGDDKRAVQAYQEALRLQPDYPEAWYNLGFAHMRAEAWEDAEKAFRTAIRVRPDYYRAWFNLGRVHALQGRNADAADAYRKALAIRPRYQRARINLAVTLSRMGDPRHAVELYEEVLKQDATYAIAWRNVGMAYLDLNDLEAARDAFRRALELEPGDTGAMRHLAQALLALKDTDGAIRVLTEAVDRESADPELRMALGHAYQAAGRLEQAQVEYEKARVLRTP